MNKIVLKGKKQCCNCNNTHIFFKQQTPDNVLLPGVYLYFN